VAVDVTKYTTILPLGQVPLLVVRLGWTDVPLTTTVTEWSDLIFGNQRKQLNEYELRNTHGSMSFKPVIESEGVANDGIITINMNYTHPQYTDINGSQKSDVELRKGEALAIVDNYVDFAQYDLNGDNTLSSAELTIIFVLAGQEQAMTADKAHNGSVWGRWMSGFMPFYTQDAVKLLDIVVKAGDITIGELHGTQIATVGIVAHELHHDLYNSIDIYDLDNTTRGIGNFGMMSGGAHGFDVTRGDRAGDSPALANAYTQIKAGLVVPQEINASTNGLVSIPANLTTYNVIKINTSRPNEYFLVENYVAVAERGNPIISGWDNLNSGLLVLRVNENKTDNTDETNRMVEVIEADGNTNIDYKDAFHNTMPDVATTLFYEGNAVVMSPNSLTASSNFADGTSSGITLDGVSRNADGSISFNVTYQ